jgi:hypothetical protein
MRRQLGVQQKSRRDDMSVENSTFAIKKSRRDDMSVENSTFAIKKSRRDDMSVENSTFAIKKSRRDDMSVVAANRWNNLLLLTCHPYGILLTANIFSTDMSSLRDFLSYTNNLTMHILLFIHKNNLLSFLSLLKVGNLNYCYCRDCAGYCWNHIQECRRL